MHIEILFLKEKKTYSNLKEKQNVFNKTNSVSARVEKNAKNTFFQPYAPLKLEQNKTFYHH